MLSKIDKVIGKTKNIIENKGQTLWPFSPPFILVLLVILISLAICLPIIYLIIRAWSSGELFLTLLFREQTFTILLNTITLAGTVTLSTIIISIPLAWLTVRTDLKGRRIWSVLTMIPLVIPSLVGGFTFVSTFSYGGILHQLLRNFNINYNPNIYGFFGAWAVLTLLSYPYVLLSVRGALLGMDPAQEEAARSLGKSSWQIFYQITLPQLRPAIVTGSLLVALYTLSDFAAVSLLQYNTFTRVIYLQYQASFNRTYASVLALVLVLLTLIIVSGEMWTRGKTSYYKLGSGSKRNLSTVKLGYWKLPALIFCCLIVFLTLVIPLGVISFWLIRGLLQGEVLLISWQAAFNSLYVSAITAIIGIIVTIPLAIFIVRYHSKFSSLIEKISYTAYALPGIVVALSLVFFAANYASYFYQSIFLLIFAYIILFLPQAIGALRSSLLQTGPNIENAALTLGCSKLKILAKIIIPLIKPGILTGTALIFLTAMKELPATLLLSPIGFRSLTTEIWNATTEAFYTRAAGPALLLLIISSFSLWILFFQEKR